MAFGFACNPCSASDPATDTVKVSFPSPQATEDKENVARMANLEAKLAEERAAAKRKAEEAEKNRLAEARRQEAEAADRRAAEKQAAAARAAQEEAEAEAQRQAAIQAALEADEADRQQAAEAAALAAKAEADRKVCEFLKTHGFKDDVNAKKSTLFKSTYPLHVAVKEQDPEMVKLLILAGADKSLKNSSGFSPVQKAQQYTNKSKAGKAGTPEQKLKKESISREVLLALDC